MPDELEERLERHARSFDGLLSLIPAKLYYGEDVSDQWKRKKQTPEQKREAKKQKLDPDNWKSAKDVMDERAAAAKKRKREEDGEGSGSDLVDPEKPKFELDGENPRPKKRKPNQPEKQPQQAETEDERIARKKEARAAKKERKKERKEKAKEKLERQKARKRGEPGKSDPEQSNRQPKAKKERHQAQPKPKDDSEDDDDDMAEEIQIDQQPANALTTQLENDDPRSEASEEPPADVFSPPQESGMSSTSSIQLAADAAAPSKAQTDAPTSDPNLPPPRERLAAALANFRSQRKADSSSAPKSRAELLEQRRRQEETRRAEQKEQKRREKEEAQRQQEEEIARRFSPGGSGSLLGSPRSPISTPDAESNNFSFGRIAFDDGTAFDPTTNGVSEPRRKKGPSDPSTALQAAMKKKSRLSGLDADKQDHIASKDMWMNARKRAAGEKVKDDTSLLKKALKRHDGQKKKSEKEWKDRGEGIQKSIDAKQKKRTENLAKRRDEKGKGKGKKVKRPGFEGSFKGRTGGKKGKA